jgi:hypothetical protein
MNVQPNAVSDSELDILESQVPGLASTATHVAHVRALAANPQGVLCIDAGNLVRISQDGNKTVVAKAKPRHRVKVGEVITVRRVDAGQAGA